jgi:hypothetical protein
MILGFKTHFQDGTPTNFREKILAGIKQTTIREDSKDRFKVGTKLHFATGVRTKQYEQFAEGIVIETVIIRINPAEKFIGSWQLTHTGLETYGFDDSSESFTKLVEMEGFDSADQFWDWFNKPFLGKMILWSLSQ